MRKDRGFTLIETMVVVVIIGILASVAIPGMQQYMESRRVVSAAEEIVGFIFNARSEAIARSEQVDVRIVPGASSAWAVGMEVEPAVGVGDCNPLHDLGGASPCVLSVSTVNVLRRILGTGYANVTLTTTTGTINFDPVRGTANDATITIRNNIINSELRVTTSLTGRIKICRPNASGKGGYSAC